MLISANSFSEQESISVLGWVDMQPPDQVVLKYFRVVNHLGNIQNVL